MSIKRLKAKLDLLTLTFRAELYMMYHCGVDYNFLGCTLSIPVYWHDWGKENGNKK